MIDTQAIRSKILDLAMRGKLTEQLPEDGTAEKLYRQIQVEKQALIKAGKIKKEKPLPEIAADEVPFEIPENWYVCHVADINYFVSETTNPLNNPDTMYELFSVPEFFTGKPEILKGDRIGSTKQLLHENDVLVCKINPRINRVWRVTKHTDFTLIGSSEWIPFQNSNLDAQYMCYYFQASFFRQYMLSNLTGVGGSLTRAKPENFKGYPVLLPPLAEQHRIVARIEQAFSALDTIDALQTKYADNLAVLKSKLIDAAIQGKLTEQLPEDGTAEELYRQIQAEKQALIKAGKIKKEKPLPEITADEIPFDIPKSWKWVRTGDVFSVGTGLTPLTNEKRFYENGRIPWVTSSLTSNRYIQDATTYLSEYALEATSLRLHPEHTLIIAMYGEGKTRGQIAELLIPATTNQACATLDNIVYNQATVDYVYFFFTHNYVQLRSQAGGSNQPNLNLNKIKETPIPLPPLAEQKRIVAKLEEVLPLCDQFRNVH